MFDIAKFIGDAPIKLKKGGGDPATGGCWMSALSLYSGARWTDHPPCVDFYSGLGRLCIRLNDMLSDERRGEIIQPHILAPVGTATDDDAIIRQRKDVLCDAALQRWTPYVRKHVNHSVKFAVMRIDAEDAARSKDIDLAFDTLNRARTILIKAHGRGPAIDAFGRDQVLPVILEMCEIGNSAPMEPACETVEFRRAVGVAN